MRTELIFFDNVHESAKGTLRGFLAALVLVPITAIWYGWIRNKIWPKTKEYKASTTVIISTILVYLLAVSAIGVQLPSSVENVAVYSALVGLVIFGCISLVNVMVIDGYNWWKVLGDTAVGVIGCCLGGIVANTVTGVV